MESSGTIKEFEIRKAEAEDRIKILASGIGYSLLTKESEAWLSTVSGQNGKLSIDKYNSYNIERNRLQDDILEIRSTVSGILSSKNSVDESKRQITVLQSEWNKLYEKLGQALFENYTAEFASFFGSYYTDIAVLKQKAAETASSAEVLKQERQIQPFFKKIISTVKYSSMIGSQKYNNNQIKTLFIKGGMNAWITGTLFSETSNSLFPVPLQDALNDCISLKNKIERIESESKAYTSKISDYQSHLTKMNANGNGKVRIADIEKLIKTKQLQQDAECVIIGNNFYAEFAGVKSEKDLSLPDSFSTETKESIREMFRRHKEIESYNRKIKMITLSVDIERLEKQMDSYTKKFTANNHQISLLQHDNDELSEQITKSKRSVKELLEQRATISLLDSGSISLPESTADDINDKSKATEVINTVETTKTTENHEETNAAEIIIETKDSGSTDATEIIQTTENSVSTDEIESIHATEKIEPTEKTKLSDTAEQTRTARKTRVNKAKAEDATFEKLQNGE